MIHRFVESKGYTVEVRIYTSPNDNPMIPFDPEYLRAFMVTRLKDGRKRWMESQVEAGLAKKDLDLLLSMLIAFAVRDAETHEGKGA